MGYTNMNDEARESRKEEVVVGVGVLWRLIRGIGSWMFWKQQNLQQNQLFTKTKQINNGIKMGRGVGNDC
jgi:uncharacterized protein HemX